MTDFLSSETGDRAEQGHRFLKLIEYDGRGQERKAKGVREIVSNKEKLQLIKFFYCKTCLAYQFAKQARPKFIMLRYG
ncbi:MAG: hypothetical protein QME44_04300 [Thermodesulfobacteriota bacterium]|nr:hypothetical protein [Thermodesulfobacteriota bacterium]